MYTAFATLSDINYTSKAEKKEAKKSLKEIIATKRSMKGDDIMTKLKQLNKYEMTARIVRYIPEINPAYVSTVLSDTGKCFFSADEVGSWIVFFEKSLYR